MNNPKYIIVHHTGGTRADPRADTSHHTFGGVDRYHKSLWNFRSSLGHYIGYHYFIDKAGGIIQGRGDNDEGAHTKGMNSISLGVCLAGNFDVTLPTAEQEEALKGLLEEKCDKHNINLNDIEPHRSFSSKTCYGKRLSDDWARNLVHREPPMPRISEEDVKKRQISIMKELIAKLQKLLKLLKGRNS